MLEPLYQLFSNLHWHFPCCKYQAVTHIKRTGKIKMWPKKTCLIGKSHSSAMCYSSNMWLSFLIKWTQLLAFSADFKIPTNCLTKCLDVLVAFIETNTWLRFLVTGKIWSVKNINIRLHKSYQSFLSLLSTLKSFI